MARHRTVAPKGWRTLSDHDLVSLVADDLRERFDPSLLDPTTTFQTLEPSPGQLALYATQEFEKSMMFEGVYTTLRNSASVSLPAAVDGYRLFAAPDMEQAVLRIVQYFEFKPYPYDMDLRLRLLESIDESAPELDEMYESFDHALGREGDAAAAYIRAHPDEFFQV